MLTRTQPTIVFLVFLSFASACSDDQQQRMHPIQLGIIYDCTLSAPQNQVPVLTASHLDSLIALCRRHGGTLGFLPIAKASFVPLVRLDLQAADGNTLREKARLLKQQRVRIAAWRTGVLSTIDSGRTVRKTDFWGAIHRTNQLFQEPAIGAPPRRFLLIISDGLDDMKRWQPIKLPADVTVVAVGLSHQSNAKSMSDKIMLFENIEPALRHLRHLAQHGEPNGELS